MENNLSKEKWMEAVMDSAGGIARAQPPAGLFEKVCLKLNAAQPAKTIPIPAKQWAAAAVILLSLNISSVLYFTSGHKIKGQINTGNPIVAEMQAVSTYNY